MSQKGNEVFYIDKNGRKDDAAIHDEILAGVDPAADLRHRTESFYRSVAKGADPAVAARAYGLPEGFDLGPGPESLR